MNVAGAWATVWTRLMGGAAPRRKALQIWLILPGPREHPTLRARREMSSMKLSHEFRLETPEAIDGGFEALIGEAWELAKGE